MTTRTRIAVAAVLTALVACADTAPSGDDLTTAEGELSVALCGGPGGLPCGEGAYCRTRAGVCDEKGAFGTCQTPPTVCPLVVKPVCGCDGVTYGNECELAAAGKNLLHAAPCAVPCTVGADDCPGGMLCDPVAGCGDSIAGTCVQKPTSCPRTWAPVCGCNGKTYANDCARVLAGADKAHDGACPPTCGGLLGTQCKAGAFCDYPAGTCGAADQAGLCAVPPHACPDVWAPVCGCDGVTYGNDCERRAAGASLLHDGACKPDSECLADGDCGAGEYCALETVCICPPDTDPACLAPCLLIGTCEALPAGACNTDADCAAGEVCSPPEVCPGCAGCPCFGTCEAPSPECCKTDEECGAGFECVGTKCKELLEPGACWSDADCVEGAHCKDPFVCPCGALCGPLPDKAGTCAYDYPPCNGDGSCPSGSQCTCLADPSCPDCDGCWFACVPK